MKFLKTAAVLVAAAATSYALVTPATAGGSISIDSPQGDDYASGEEVFVSGYNDSYYSETLDVECNNSYRYVSIDVDPGSFSVSIGSFTGPDTCRIWDSGYATVLARFTVAPPATTVSEASVNNDAFYPLVRDGYRDGVTFRWRQDRRARATIAVVNSAGRTVRTAMPRAYRGRNSWEWNGKKNNGDVVAEGRYRIWVTVNTNSVSAVVSAKTEIVTKTYRARKEGNRASSLATRGSCYADRDSYFQIATIDCWGGRYAKANYRFAIPASAFDVRGVIDLNRNDLDRCCHGKITKGWSRPSKRTVALWAKVTGWRTTDVNFVRVTYKNRVRI